MYVLWAQNDDFAFLVIIILLLSVLYVLWRGDVEGFSEGGATTSATGAVGIPIDFAAYTKLVSLKDDVVKVVQPRFEHLISAFRGSAKVDREQKYDDDGNEVGSGEPDEVAIDGSKEKEIRAMNAVLYDLKTVEPGHYYALLALANGGDTKVVEEEYVL